MHAFLGQGQGQYLTLKAVAVLPNWQDRPTANLQY
jgi:hypothetical protein